MNYQNKTRVTQLKMLLKQKYITLVAFLFLAKGQTLHTLCLTMPGKKIWNIITLSVSVLATENDTVHIATAEVWWISPGDSGAVILYYSQ